MENNPKKVLISVGEASGDLHASNLIKATNKIAPDIEFYGMGSDLMEQAGAKIIVNSKTLSVFGGLEIITNLFKIWRAFNVMKKALFNDKPDLLILIDYPGFNLRLAKTAKKAGVKVLYYITPKVWAWHQSRVKIIKDCVDRMAVIFPFEVDFYNKYQVPVTFVGNPLLDKLPKKISKQEAIQKLSVDQKNTTRRLKPAATTVGLFPGSRSSEIKRLLPVMLEAASLLKKSNPDIQFLLPRASSISEEELNIVLDRYPNISPTVISGKNYDVMQACDTIVAASGTVTLEIALMEIPLVIIYKMAWLEYPIAKLLVKVAYIGLCNILADKKIVQELIQDDAYPENIAKEIERILKDSDYRNEMLHNLKSTKSLLEDYKREDIASLVIEMVSKN